MKKGSIFLTKQEVRHMLCVKIPYVLLHRLCKDKKLSEFIEEATENLYRDQYIIFTYNYVSSWLYYMIDLNKTKDLEYWLGLHKELAINEFPAVVAKYKIELYKKGNLIL